MDWVAWYEKKHGKPAPAPYFTYRIPLSELEEGEFATYKIGCCFLTKKLMRATVAKAQGTEFRQGDILLVRTGFSHWYDHIANAEEREKYLTVSSYYISKF